MQFDEKKIYDYVTEHRDEYIALLARLCNQKSLAMTGEGIEEMYRIVVDILKEHGLDVTVCETPGNPCIIAEMKGETDRTFGFYHHYDVMPVEPLDDWESDPWKLTIRDGVMYARGVSDNKGGLCSSLCAVDAYMKVYGKLPCNVKFLLEGEEEVGSPNLSYFAGEYADRIGCDGIIFEGGDRNGKDAPLEITSGVKGLLYLELETQGIASDAHSSLAIIAPNAAWRLVNALNTLKDGEGNILVEGFYDDVKPLEASDLEVLKNDAFDEEATRTYLGIEAFNNQKTGIELLKDYHYAPTLNLAGLVSGYTGEGSKTVLPAKAVAKIDIRLVPDMDPLKTAERIRKHLDRNGFSDIRMRILTATPSYRSASDSAFMDVMIRSAKKFTGLEPRISHQHPATMPFALLCREKGIPAGSVGCGTPHNNSHGPNEKYVIEDFLDDIRFRSVMLQEMGRCEET